MSEFQKIYMSKLLCKCSFRTDVIVDITGEESGCTGLHGSYFYAKTEIIGIRQSTPGLIDTVSHNLNL